MRSLLPAVRSFPLRPARTERPELMDDAGYGPRVLAENFRDIRRVNRWLAGARLTIRGLERLTLDLRSSDALTVLDVATGCADIPEAMVAWGRRRGLGIRVLATDISPPILGLAPRDAPGIELALADGKRLPLADRSIDIATCSLILHHIPLESAGVMLQEMRRVSRRGVVVNDLVRSWHGYAGAWALSRLTTRNPLTRHDAPLSVLRSYTRKEMTALAKEAGLEPIAFPGFLGYRIAMVARARS